MIALILMAVQGEESEISRIARSFGVDWTHLGAQFISFAIVCAILYKFAYRRVLAMLEERRSQIAQGLANAESIKNKLAQIESEREEIMARAYMQSAKCIEDAHASAARVLDQETKNAIATAERIVEKAREAAAQEHDRMLAQLKHEVGRLVVRTTSTVTGKILTPEDHRRLAEEAARQVAA